mmetsp:Transcript_16823/g.35584  ORF Transcript_16823/g.35584 Transcript_16823/m.35584 type:complete len:452 (-) Transcript_16823:283-1638(-)
MPPKKKGKSKSKKKSKEVDPEEKVRQELLHKALSLQGEAAQEDALEKQLSKQSESLKGYWEIEKKTRKERQRTLLEKEHRLQDIQDKHFISLGEYKQSIKEILFANQDEISEKTTQSFMEYQSLSDRHQNEVGQLHNELNEISNRIKDTSISYDRFKISMQQDCSDRAMALREEASHKIATLATYAEKQFKRTREDAERRLMEEVRQAEEQNDAAIQEVMEKNKDEIQQMRTTYSTTMNENLDEITKLRKEVVLLREQDRLDRQVLSELRNQNNDIIVPLETNRKDLHRLESDLDAFYKQKQDLDSQKQRLRRAENELKDIEWDHEVLFQKLQALETDRDDWKKKAQHSIHSARQKSNFKNLLLERKLSKLSMTGEQNTAAMAELLRKSNIDLDSLDQSQVHVTDVISEKKNQVELLKKKLQQIKDARASMMERHRSIIEKANKENIRMAA